ncbi:MAG: Trm112 family protein [Enterovibrio sp.]
MDHRLFEILACPNCKGKLNYKKTSNEFICKFDRIAFPVHDDIPVLLMDQARPLTAEEQDLSNSY